MTSRGGPCQERDAKAEAPGAPRSNGLHKTGTRTLRACQERSSDAEERLLRGAGRRGKGPLGKGQRYSKLELVQVTCGEGDDTKNTQRSWRPCS